MTLGPDPHTVAMRGIAENPFLRNQAKILLREVNVECGTTAHTHNQKKVKIK